MASPRRSIPSLLSSLAVLSFKRKNDGGRSEFGSLERTQADGDVVSLNSLNGGIGIDDRSPGTYITGEGAARQDEEKFQELEASVNDLMKQAESADQNHKVTKGELDDIKKNLGEINESIRNLLNVYEAVSRPYNPFVDNEPSVEAKGNRSARSSLISDNVIDMKLGGQSEAPFDERGPLDRIVKPDREEPIYRPITNSMSMVEDLAPSRPASKSGKILCNAIEGVNIPASTSLPFDAFALEQFHRLVVHQINKVYEDCLSAGKMKRNYLEDLDRWLSEFKRIGGT